MSDMTKQSADNAGARARAASAQCGDKVTQRNAASSEESPSAARELAGQAQELAAATIGAFRLDQGVEESGSSTGAAAASQPRSIRGTRYESDRAYR
jgi:methyl-accepting chemotaxis protein